MSKVQTVMGGGEIEDSGCWETLGWIKETSVRGWQLRGVRVGMLGATEAVRAGAQPVEMAM